jgi:hypothetical protein
MQLRAFIVTKLYFTELLKDFDYTELFIIAATKNFEYIMNY